jgi:6-phosphogluconolactonase
VAGKLQIHIQKTREDLARFTAERMVACLALAIEQRGSSSLVLSGGETPRHTYELLVDKSISDGLDWNRVYIFFGDERTVPPDHPDSNYGMARHALIARVPLPPENVHRIKGELAPEQAALDYQATLQKIYGKEIPRFDCNLLGIGDDGHTASLFPGTNALNEKKKWVTHLFVPRLKTWRISLTFLLINNAREIIFLAAGSKKASVIRNVLESAGPSVDLPATMVRPRDGILHWMLDTEAASLIGSRDH